MGEQGDSGSQPMDISDDENNLTGEECLKRCQQFAEITGTNTALASSILQDHQWNVSKALFVHFGWSQLDTVLSHKPEAQVQLASLSSSALQGYEGRRLRVMSWNLDGLEGRNLVVRTEAVVECILRERCHIVMLQEVVAANETILRQRLEAHFHFFSSSQHSSSAQYYSLILHHKGTINHAIPLKPVEVQSFSNSTMGRNLLAAPRLTFQGLTLYTLTAHLESTRDFSKERKEQLQQCWNMMENVANGDPQAAVLFAGDLNLRDKEVAELGGVPTGILDLWSACKSRKEAYATWDPQRNSNAGEKLAGSGYRSPGLRFDRMYFLQKACSIGKGADPQFKRLQPVYFELSGLEKVPGYCCYPSDHWAILVHFDVE